MDRALARGQRRGFAIGEAIDADDLELAALDRLDPQRVGLDQPPLQFARLDRRDHPAHAGDRLEFGLGLGDSSAATRRSTSTLPSKMSPYSSRSVS